MVIRKLKPYIKGYGRTSILCSVTVFIEVLLEISIPMLMAQIIDVGITNRDIGYVLRTGGLMVAMALLSLLMGALSGRFASVAGMGFAKQLRFALFEKIQSFSFANIDRFSTPSLVTRLTTDINNTQMAYMMIIRMLVRSPIMLISATFMAFSINARLVTVFLVAIPVLAVALGVIIKFAFTRFQKMLTKYDQLNGTVQENLIGIRVVKAFVRAGYEKKRFGGSADALRETQMKAEKVVMCNAPVMQIVMYGCILAILWFGGNMIIGGSMLTGELISFISYVTQILMSLMMLSMIVVNLVLSRASVGRILEVLDEELDIKDPAAADAQAVADGSVVFEDVCFGYAKDQSEPVLQQINLAIRPGETIGIIGGTGSAKTTLVQLIPRLYDVSKGRILVGGRDVRTIPLEVLRQSIGMVLQKNVLFSGTIEENLRWGNADATEEEIRQACRAAQADEFVSSFPDGYKTDLGQGGVNVSGGQKQRLCIARALLKKPKILILDDSTSAVDTATDSKIRQALREQLRETTTIIIAQRITSVSDADRIVVLSDGKIDGVGTHEELLASNEIYREVYSSQQKGVA